jgi:hypothetical protein
MHLLPAFVTTTNSKKRKSKLTGKQKLSLAAHQKWVDSMTGGKRADKNILDKAWRTEYKQSMAVERSAFEKSGIVPGACSKPEEKVYTGGNLLGVATMHKSNMVPIFKKEDAADIASMRR